MSDFSIIVTDPTNGDVTSVDYVPAGASYVPTLDRIEQALTEYQRIIVWDHMRVRAVWSFEVNKPMVVVSDVDLNAVDAWVQQEIIQDVFRLLSRIQMLKKARENFPGLGLKDGVRVIDRYYVI